MTLSIAADVTTTSSSAVDVGIAPPTVSPAGDASSGESIAGGVTATVATTTGCYYFAFLYLES